jgi:exopolyphosphatase / guanosine-5'-triphosphate,3'-diphosphate pyrophosphatase
VTRNVAVVDIGSTSIQITVAEVSADALKILAKKKHIARLADELDDQGYLSSTVVEGLINTLKELIETAHRFNATVTITATATLRAAKNSQLIIDRVGLELGLSVKLLSGSDEAKLVLSGVLFGHQRLRESNVLAIDVGGGSTELVTGIRGRAATIASVSIGALVAHRNWLGFDSPSSSEVKRTRQRIKRRFRSAFQLSRAIEIHRLVGTGGTIQRLLRLHHGENLPSIDLNGMPLSLEDLNGCIEKLLRAKTPEGRRSLPGIDADRADFLLGGALVFSEAICALGTSGLMVSTSALRTGMLTMTDSTRL